MPSNRERLCCHEIQKCKDRFRDAIEKYGETNLYMCICNHEGFRVNCLRWDVLDLAWITYKQQYGPDAYENANVNKKYRHIAYRQLSRLLFGIVGKYNRYILPSCAVTKIRHEFPIQENEGYIGFMYTD